jgi:hypothetical protein
VAQERVMGNKKLKEDQKSRAVCNYDRVTLWIDHDQLSVSWKFFSRPSDAFVESMQR